MKFKHTLILTFGIFVFFLLMGVFVDKSFNTTNSVTINTSSLKAYNYLNDLTTWQTWGSWTEDDPSLQITYGDITQGVGASNTWVGKDGDGRLKFVESTPSKIIYNMWFKENSLQSQGEFLIEPQGEVTKVTWVIRGQIDEPLIGGYMAKLIESLNTQFAERSLKKLKNVLEN